MLQFKVGKTMIGTYKVYVKRRVLGWIPYSKGHRSEMLACIQMANLRQLEKVVAS